MELTEEELRVLAHTILGEAAGEGPEGMTAVMNVIMNRAADPRYPDNPAMVALQKNQFSTWNSKKSGGNDPVARFPVGSEAFEEALQIVQAVASGTVEDNTQGATHFYSKSMLSKPPAWFEEEGPKGAKEIGNHVFAARTDPPAPEPAPFTQGLTARARQQVPLPRSRPTSFAPVGVRATGAPPTTKSQDRLVAGGGGGDLTTRTVRTVGIDPTTGRPIQSSALEIALQAEAARRRVLIQNQNDLVGRAAAGPDAAASGKTSRGRTVQDLFGAAAAGPDAAAPGKTSRARPDLVGAQAADSRAAAPGKTSRARATTTTLTNDQRRAEARSEQAIQRALARGQGTQPFRPSSGVTRTAGGIAGTVQLPRNVRPNVTIPEMPKPPTRATRFAPVRATPSQVEAGSGFRLPGGTAFTVAPRPAPPPDNSKRLAAGKNLFIAGEITPKGPARGRGAAGAAKRKLAARKEAIAPVGPKAPEEPLIEEVVAAREPVIRRQPVVVQKTPEQLAREQVAAQFGAMARIGTNGYIYRPGAPGQAYQRVGTAPALLRTAASISANYNPAHLAAAAAGRKSYTLSDGSSMPTKTIGGKLRKSYADDGNTTSTPGFYSSNPSWW